MYGTREAVTPNHVLPQGNAFAFKAGFLRAHSTQWAALLQKPSELRGTQAKSYSKNTLVFKRLQISALLYKNTCTFGFKYKTLNCIKLCI
jgi:hypothetical protein